MQKLWIVYDGRLAQHDIVVSNIVVLHELEEGLDRVSSPKIVGGGDVNLLKIFLQTLVRCCIV